MRQFEESEKMNRAEQPYAEPCPGSGSCVRTQSVAAAACPDYSEETVRRAVSQVLKDWNGFDRVASGTRVAVKVNLVSAQTPDRAATTHPQLVCELCRQLIARGAEVTVGDSPGGLFTKDALKRVYKVSGMTKVEQTGAKLNYDTDTEDVNFPDAVSAHVFRCTFWLRRADLIIDFAKLKAHGMVGMTAAVKNMFGSIPGTTKPEYHMRFPETRAFCNMLIDLNESLRPALYLVDAVLCMEGNGPTAGSPRHLGLLLGSEDPYSLDMVCGSLIGMTREDVPTLQCAYERGLGPGSVSDVKVIGEDISRWTVKDFRSASRANITFTGNGPLGHLAEAAFRKAMQQVPMVSPAECVGCGKCFRVCPAHAITMVSGRPKIDRKKCIHCFCCQEFCPKGAMKVHRTLLARMLQKK